MKQSSVFPVAVSDDFENCHEEPRISSQKVFPGVFHLGLQVRWSEKDEGEISCMCTDSLQMRHDTLIALNLCVNMDRPGHSQI